ncbi:39S ribosomal protein L34, mitochondrial isoform X1 [Oncorhynchus tshawytscha]|uniref:Large ribosomal subunit protein bL34m n=1 Tax=Oncorhynchus tshawytscha TaxID=74940 RepID=A0A8C8GQ38_ONCTS|nr:39S ribosomal protein L34, mitochondrial isoform X1 [Oncorhynchus tshawytscha]
MNTIRSSVYRFHGVICSTSRNFALELPGSSGAQPRSLSGWVLSWASVPPLTSWCGPLTSQAEGAGVFQQPPWHHQQVRTGKRGTEYQPKNIKRKRTHGWIKRISTQGGIEVILRRMLKGRKSLSH